MAADIQLSVIFGGQYSFQKLQSDWNQEDTLARDFIKNKPDFVPYTGANKDVDLGDNSVSLQSVIFNAETPASPEVGELWYDEDSDSLAYKRSDGGVTNVNQEPQGKYVNADTVTLTNGMIVSTAGINGNRKGVKRTNFANIDSIRSIIGVVTVDSISTNQSGMITKAGGVISDVPTNGLREGVQLWGNQSVLGGWTATKPEKGNYAVQIGQVVVAHNVVGSIEFNPVIPSKIGDLDNVNLSNPAEGDNLKLVNGLWVNSKLLSINEITPADELEINGSLLVSETIESVEGFKKTGKTDLDILLAGAGTISIADLKAGICKLFNPTNSTQVVLEINSAGHVLITGDILHNGTSYETHAQNINTPQAIINLRDGAIVGLNLNELAGFIIEKYDGTNNGYIAIDKDGVLRIGDAGSLQPVLTREETPVDKSPMIFNSTTNRAETIQTSNQKATLASDDLVLISDSENSNNTKYAKASAVKDLIEKDLIVYVSDDTTSVTLGIGSAAIVSESTTGYPSLTIQINTL